MINSTQKKILASFILGDSSAKEDALKVHRTLLEAHPEFINGHIGKYMDSVNRELAPQLQDFLKRKASTAILG
jgi:hypothetical protein